MAHYDRKYRLENFDLALDTCEKLAHVQYSMREEIDDYFANFTPGQFTKLRRYNPPIHIPINPNTGEMWHVNATDIIYGEHAGDLVLSHHFIMEGMEESRTRVAVLTAQNPAHADEIATILKQGYPVDTHIVKQRAAYSINIEGYPVLIHLDKSVKDTDGNDLGSFIEFEIKTQPNDNVSDKKRQSIFDDVENCFESALGVQVHENYRDMMHGQFGDYGPWVKTLPEATFKELRNIPSFKVNQGDLIIRDFETRHHDGFFVMEGETRVFYQNGPEIRRIGKHDFFGEMACRSPEKRRNGNVEAVTDLMVKQVPEGLLQRLYQDPKMANHFLDRYLTDEAKRTNLRHKAISPGF